MAIDKKFLSLGEPLHHSNPQDTDDSRFSNADEQLKYTYCKWYGDLETAVPNRPFTSPPRLRGGEKSKSSQSLPSRPNTMEMQRPKTSAGFSPSRTDGFQHTTVQIMPLSSTLRTQKSLAMSRSMQSLRSPVSARFTEKLSKRPPTRKSNLSQDLHGKYKPRSTHMKILIQDTHRRIQMSETQVETIQIGK